MKELIVDDGVRRAPHLHLSNLIGAAAIIETMNEMAEEDRLSQPKSLTPQRKRALSGKRAKRKMKQASRKRNR